MDIYVDTSIWVRFLDHDDPLSMRVRKELFDMSARGASLILSSQVLREMWVVLSRPQSANGLGLGPEETRREVQACISISHVVEDAPLQWRVWFDLVVHHSVSGKQVHDANQVAFMLSQGIHQIFTLDRRDFERYRGEGITLLTLESIP